MTKSELWSKLLECLSMSRDESQVVFERVIGPYLAIPRSLKDDPPKSGDSVILLGNGIVCAQSFMEAWIAPLYLTHWIPFPYPPQPDKDEQEFEEFWSHRIDTNRVHKEIAKHSWMASRGRK